MADPFPNCIKQRVQVNPSLPAPGLAQVWEWNDDGTPIFQDLERHNARHLPASLLLSNFAQTVVGSEFVNWIQQHQQNNEPYVVSCRGQGHLNSVRRSLLGIVYQGDVKKMFVENNVDGIQITKLDYNTPLIDYDPPGGSYPFQNITTKDKKCSGGPGTYACRHGNCKRTGPCTTQSTVVQWGPEPGQSINVNRRLTCDSNYLVYLIHCNACLEEGNWTTYIGESENFFIRTVGGQTGNFHQRLSTHLTHLVDEGNRDRFPMDDNLPELILGIVDGNPDTHQLLRDPYVHFNYLDDRRVTILETGFPNQKERRRAEHLWQIQCGN